MLNISVHLDVEGLPHGIEDDELVEAIWSELPDASIGGHYEILTVTLSQFALTDRRAVARQRGRPSVPWPPSDTQRRR